MTINYILVDSNDKQFNESNQQKLNKDLIRKNETCYNKCCYCMVNIYTRLTQLERVNSDLKRKGYEFPKLLCIPYKINQEINLIQFSYQNIGTM